MKEILVIGGLVCLIAFSMIGYNLYQLHVQSDLYKLCIEARKDQNKTDFCYPPR